MTETHTHLEERAGRPGEGGRPDTLPARACLSSHAGYPLHLGRLHPPGQLPHTLLAVQRRPVRHQHLVYTAGEPQHFADHRRPASPPHCRVPGAWLCWRLGPAALCSAVRMQRRHLIGQLGPAPLSALACLHRVALPTGTRYTVQTCPCWCNQGWCAVRLCGVLWCFCDACSLLASQP
jgi:hypothetical protein